MNEARQLNGDRKQCVTTHLVVAGVLQGITTRFTALHYAAGYFLPLERLLALTKLLLERGALVDPRDAVSPDWP